MWGNVVYFSVFKLKIAAFLIIALSLSGCMETASDLNAMHQKSSIQQVQAPNIPVMLVSIDGAPDSKILQLNNIISTEAKQRNIILVAENAQPRFKIKGYISAYGIQGGTALSWVWDVYDTRLQRAQRIDGSTIVKKADVDPWSTIDDTTLKTAASASMNDITVYLASAKIEPLPAPKKLPEKTAPREPASPVSGAALAKFSPSTQPPKFSALDLRR